MKIHNERARTSGFMPVAFISFIEIVVPTRNSVTINNLFAIKTIKFVATSGKKW